MEQKLFAVFTAPDRLLYARKMWQRRLESYLSGCHWLDNLPWRQQLQDARMGDLIVLKETIGIVRIQEDLDHGDTE